MKDFKDKVAVITGAAGGIGRGLAERCALEGMKIVLADVEEAALIKTEKELKAEGAKTLAVRTDVSSADDVEALARKTLDTFGAVHLLFNNAGVAAGTSAWESTLGDWEWTIGVNLWGVIHGVRSFVPRMLEQNTDAYVVNTASIAGLLSFGLCAPYQVSKHAVVALSEQLYHSLARKGAKVKVSVLCPGFVKTGILEAERNRPDRLKNEKPWVPSTPEMAAAAEYMRNAVLSGTPPLQLAESVFQALNEERFYILTHPEINPLAHMRAQDILEERNPSPFPG